MYTCQREGLQMVQSSDVLLKEFFCISGCPLIEDSLCTFVTYFQVDVR